MASNAGSRKAVQMAIAALKIPSRRKPAATTMIRAGASAQTVASVVVSEAATATSRAVGAVNAAASGAGTKPLLTVL